MRDRDAMWDVIPGDRIGPLALGMTKAELLAAWETIPDSWKSEPEMFTTIPSQVHCDYDADGRCTRISFRLDAPVPIMLFGEDMRDISDDAFYDRLARLGPVTGSYGSIEVASAGVGAYKWERDDATYLCIDIERPK